MLDENWTQDVMDQREAQTLDEAFEMQAADWAAYEADLQGRREEEADAAPDRQQWRHRRLGESEVVAEGVIRFDLTCDDRAEVNVRKSIDKLSRRLKKWGGEVKITAEREQWVDHWSGKRDKTTGKVVQVRQVVLTVESPALAGTSRTKLVGSFEQSEDGADVYRHALGDADPAILEPYLKDARWKGCDHCGHNRHRKATFLCELEDGSLKLVGRQCSRDFLGLEPGDILARATIYNELKGLAGDEDTEGSWGAFPSMFHVQSYVETAYRVAKRYGGYNREMAGTMMQEVWALQGGADFGRSTTLADIRALYKTLPEPEPLDLVALCDFVDQMDGDYGQNVRVAFSCEWAKLKRKRLVMSGVGVYVGKMLTRAQRAKDAAEKAASGPAPKHLAGVEKERVTFRAVVDRCHPFDSMYGGGLVVAMSTEDGSSIVHFSTSAFKPEVGKSYAVKATIKEQGQDRDGLPQTVVTRAAYVEEQPGSLI